MPDLSKAACELSIQHLFHEDLFHVVDGCYLWTYTFADDIKPAEAARRWRLFVRWHVNTDRKCVRVLEAGSKNGRWHYHCVTPQRWDVNEVREAAERCGFGRINVKQIPTDKAGYVAKYLRKHGRSELPRGQRRWACVGFDGVPVNRVKATSKSWFLPKVWLRKAYTVAEWNFPGCEPIRFQIRTTEKPEAEEIRHLHVSQAESDSLFAELLTGRLVMVGEYHGLSVTQKIVADANTGTRIETAFLEHVLEAGGNTKTVTEWLPAGADLNAVKLPAEPGSLVKMHVKSIRRHMGVEYVSGVVFPLLESGECRALSPSAATNLCNPY